MQRMVEKQFTIYLTPAQKKRLQKESEESGLSMASVIRIALNEYFKRATNE